jgi:hypothetical protein
MDPAAITRLPLDYQAKRSPWMKRRPVPPHEAEATPADD